MKTLFIDTSSDTLIIALNINKKLVDNIKLVGIKEHSVYAVEKIKELLEKNKLVPTDIDKIVVVNGPGSFTGIRIGVTIAKTFAYTLNKKITTASSLKNMVIGNTGYNYYISKIIDKKDKNYVGIYNSHYDTLFEGLITDSELENKMKDLDNYIIINENKYNIEKVINYYEEQENINPHKVNPNYLKEVV